MSPRVEITVPDVLLAGIVSTDNQYCVADGEEFVAVPIGDVRPLGAFQIPDLERLARILRAIRHGVPLPPIHIDQRHVVLDGHHRLIASLAVGFTHIPTNK